MCYFKLTKIFLMSYYYVNNFIEALIRHKEGIWQYNLFLFHAVVQQTKAM